MVPASIPSSANVNQNIKIDLHACLQTSFEVGSDNSPCLDLFLQAANINSLDYFEYTASAPDSLTTDACESFTGPATLENGQMFRNCLDSYTNLDTCKLPGILWSGRSQNKVPVATIHATKIQDSVALQTAALNTYTAIQTTVMNALNEIKDWSASNVNAAIFSAEGDLLHQYFDCMMMGALGHTDLWPAPDTLAKPVWSRQSDNSDNRNFELPCSGEQLKNRLGVRDNQSPFTCGSHPRRALMKYFIRSRQTSSEELDANRALITTAVQNLISSLNATWSDITNFYCQCDNGERGFQCCTLPPTCDPTTKCACADGSLPSFACCVCDGATLLPKALQVPFTSIPGSQLVQGLFDAAASFLQTTVWTSNTPWLFWDPGADYSWTDTATADTHMLLDTTTPISTYKEYGYPFKTTIWEQCYGLLEQVYFTLPLTSDQRPTTLKTPYNPDDVSKTINLTYREEWIQNLVKDAYAKSPIYWQYNMRHRPSDSLFCNKKTASQQRTLTKYVNGTEFLVHGFQAFTIGRYKVDCYCGWWYNTSTCQIPSSVCADLVQLISTSEIIEICTNGGFATTMQMEQYMSEMTKIKKEWIWPCPQMNMSDLWGVMEDEWMLGSSDVSKVWNRVLRNGTGGLRVGSFNFTQATPPVDPTQRIQKLENVAQNCEVDIENVTNHFIDELFPAVQGVRQNVVLNACLRFTIELARLYMFQEFDLVVGVAEQTNLVKNWRAKCEQKLAQVSFCSTFGIYYIMQDLNYNCPFQLNNYYKQSVTKEYSITPSCLIVFFPNFVPSPVVLNPCLCGFCFSQNLNIIDVYNDPACAVMHVRDLVLDNGLPIYPAQSDSPIPLPLARSRFNSSIPAYVANNKERWDISEGNASTYFCDMQVDWWPEEWLHPVGFHVTFPCNGGAPRTFDAAWAMAKSGDTVYLRKSNINNITKEQNEFGGAGPCRTHNYGMPMHTINTMRVCTMSDNQPYDPTVPNKAFNIPAWNTEFCSDSPFDTPWTNGPTSVGMLFDTLVDLTQSEDADITYRTCTADSDCCAACKCFVGKKSYGVCVVVQTGKFECAQHKHCSGGLMCSGEGLCVKGIMQVSNDFEDSITTRVFSDKCSGQDTWGTSKEEMIPDILRSSGLCSYRSWYEHRQTPLSAQACSNDVCNMSGFGTWRSTATPPDSLYNQKILMLQAHSCDRDYEHLQNLLSCTPSSLLLLNENGVAQTVQRGSLTQTYRNTNLISIVKHDDFGNMGFGFTGTGLSYGSMGYFSASQVGLGDSLMKPCSALLPCTLQSISGMWYVNGIVQRTRFVTVNGIIREYDLNDVRNCGSMGFVLDSTSCMIDPAVAPLFYVYCQQNGGASLCTQYPLGKYTFKSDASSFNTIATNLNNLLNTMTSKPTDWASYLSTVNTVSGYYDMIQNTAWPNFPLAKILHTYTNEKPRGLYWLLSYSAYEVPFAYWFRCTWMLGLQLSANPVSCPSWDNQIWNSSQKSEVKFESFTTRQSSVSLMQWLARADGLFTTNIIQGLRNQVHDKLNSMIDEIVIPRIPFTCFTQASFIKSYLTESTSYAYMADIIQAGNLNYNTDKCNNFETCFNHTDPYDMIQHDIVSDTKNAFKTTGPCSSSACYTGVSPPIKNYAQDSIPSTIPSDSKYVNIFTLSGSSATVSAYDSRNTGCSTINRCSGPNSIPCDCYSETVTDAELTAAQITNSDPSIPATVTFRYQFQGFSQDRKTSIFDICTSPCGFLNSNPTDVCSISSDSRAAQVQRTYCEQNQKWKVDPVNQRCVYEVDENGKHKCLNSFIGASTIQYPNQFVTVTTYIVNSIPSFRLSCGEPFLSLHNSIVNSLSTYSQTFDMILEMAIAKVDTEYLISGSLLRKHNNGTYLTKAVYFKTFDCKSSCNLNTLKTRPLSTNFKTSLLFETTLQSTDPSVAWHREMVQTIIAKTEDKFSASSIQSLQQCQKVDATNVIFYCSITDTDSSTGSLIETRACTQKEIEDTCHEKYNTYCKNRATDYANDRFGKEEDCVQLPDAACYFGVPGLIACAIAKTICTKVSWQTLYDRSYGTCYNSNMESCRSNIQCHRVKYRYVTPPVCTGTPIPSNYTKTHEKQFQDAGLPHVGFCPDCVGGNCPTTKSSYTYKQVYSNIGGFQIQPSTTTSYVDPSAKYYSLTLAPGYSCNSITCPDSTRKAEIRKNLYTCVPCRKVPEPYCIGFHMCKFANNMTFEETYSSVRSQLTKLVSSLPTSISPNWTEFLNYPSGYTYNPQPLISTYNTLMDAVKGVCGAANSVPPLTQCQNDGPRRKLQNHYLSYYKISDGYLVPPKNTLLWYVDNGQLLGTNIVSFFQASKRKFLQQLLDSKTCNNATLESLVCYFHNGNYSILNPSITGDFEVQEGCDVIASDSTRVIDSRCRKDVCVNAGTEDRYNTWQGTAYSNLETQTQCGFRTGQASRFLTTRASYDINLCSKTPDNPATCPNVQGMIGTSDGSKVFSVYSRQPWPTTLNTAGLFTNEVLTGKGSGNITLLNTDIGGHFIRMRVSKSGSMYVFDTPLRSYTSLTAANSANTSQWTTQYLRERDINSYSLKTCQDWKCPLQRRQFWTGLGKQKPIVPDPLRTSILYDSPIHPTFTRQSNTWLGAYQTRNGFCVCPVGATCSINTGPCSVSETIKSLYDYAYRPAQVLQTPCTLQMDWPYLGGTLRDDSFLQPSTSTCHVLDRIPPFQYRYMNSKKYTKSTYSTLQDGGACHMGRPVQWSDRIEHCTLLEKRSDSFILKCGTETVTLPRPASVFNSTPTLCGECSSAPKYIVGNTEIPSEVSYGQPWRWSAARLLARDLRFRLCGNATLCDEARNWSLTTFWPQMYSKVAHLFNLNAATPEAVWNSNWMLCTGENASNCQGTATKTEWLQNRAGTCDRIRTLSNAQDAVESLTVCNLDNRLDKLCSVIQNARYKLFEANCQITGACRTSSFFYQPATYNLLNNEFVRDTVSYFYNYTVPGSCPILNDETAQIIAENKQNSGKCGSVDLQFLQLVIQGAREVVHLFVEIYYYVGKIGVEIMGILGGGDISKIIDSIVADFVIIVHKFEAFFMQVADLAYKMVTETGQMGRWLKELVISICKFLNDTFDYFVRPMLCVIRAIVLLLIDFAYAVARVVTLFIADLSSIGTFRENLSNSWKCDIANPFTCDSISLPEENSPSTLPIATRCWVGDQSIDPDAGCKASDTCMNDDGSLIACAACSNLVNMVRFGCSPVTKMCQCHTFPQDQTSCSSHAECYLPDTGCAYVDGYLQPGFGNIPCSSCTSQPQCLSTGGSAQCVCMLRNILFQTCSASGALVVPDGSKLCLYSSTYSMSNARYVANYDTLASVPCALLNGAQSYCIAVYFSSTSSALLTVGLALLRTRRLLSVPYANMNFTTEPCHSIMATKEKRPLEAYLARECERWYIIGEYIISHYNVTNALPCQFTNVWSTAKIIITQDNMQDVAVAVLQHTEFFGPIGRAVVNFSKQVFQRPLAQKSIQYLNQSSRRLLWTPHNRRIFQTWKQDLQAIQQYSIKIVQGNSEVSAPDASEWLKGPFSWPPTYNYWERTHPCLVAELTLNYTFETAKSTVAYYAKSGPQRQVLPKTLWGSFPHVPLSTKPAKALPWFLSFITYVTDLSVIRHYLSSSNSQPSPFSQDIKRFFSCDFEHVQHCNGQYRTLGWGASVVMLTFVATSVIFRSLGFTAIDTLLIIVYIPSVLFYTYSYSPFCAPLIITCFGDDAIAIIEWFLPVAWHWPDAMQRWPGCSNGTEPRNADGSINMALKLAYTTNSSECLIPCNEWPFNFVYWQDNAAWLMCDLGYCNPDYEWIKAWNTAHTFLTVYVPSYISDFLSSQKLIDAIRAKEPMLMIEDMRTAQQICFTLSFIQFLPIVLAAAIVVIIATALISLVVYTVQFIVNFLLSLLIFIHIH